MAFQNNSYTVPEIVMGYPLPPSSASPPRRRWWSRPIATLPGNNDREPTCKEIMACSTPIFGAIFTVIAVYVYVFNFVDHAHSHAKFSVQSITVSPSATWHVDFLVKNPSSRYSIYYGVDDIAVRLVRLGPSNAAVLSTFHERKSRSHTAFSVDFVAEDNPKDVVLEQLDIKLRATHKIYGGRYNNAGHIDVRCHNLTPTHDNVEKIQCSSSFTKLKTLSGGNRDYY